MAGKVALASFIQTCIGVTRYSKLATGWQVLLWGRRSYRPPAPRRVKQALLASHGLPNTPWVETGTHAGTTAAFLSSIAPVVYTIEPSQTYYEKARRKFERTNVKVLEGTSEEVMPQLLSTLRGDLNFWLDGHYSGSDTFLGESATPIMAELASISEALEQLRDVVILIDDFRCFVERDGEYGYYPPPNELVSWGRTNGFDWTVEHDIFILTRKFVT